MEFNLENSLKECGFEIVGKSREMVAVKGLCSIYYAVDHIIEDGYPVGMEIVVGNETVFCGRMPQSIDEMNTLLKI